jgi:hypothetical protein
MSVCSILYMIVSAIKNWLVLISEAMKLVLELTKIVLNCSNSKLKSPH